MPEEKPIKEIEVVAYSVYRANERPVRFLLDDTHLEVERIIDRWIGEEHDFFKCLANDGQIYLLKWHRTRDQWFLL